MAKRPVCYRLENSVLKILKLAKHEVNKNLENGSKKISFDMLIERAIQHTYGSNIGKIEALRSEAREHAVKINEINNRIKSLEEMSNEKNLL